MIVFRFDKNSKDPIKPACGPSHKCGGGRDISLPY